MTVDAFSFLDPSMDFTVPDVTSRILGQQDLSAGPDLVLAYWQDPRAQTKWGPYTVTVFVNRRGLLAPWTVFRVDGIHVGTDQYGNAVLVSIRFWGQSTGVSTVVTRVAWFLVPFLHLGENLRNRVAGTTGTTTAPISGPALARPLTRIP